MFLTPLEFKNIFTQFIICKERECLKKKKIESEQGSLDKSSITSAAMPQKAGWVVNSH